MSADGIEGMQKAKMARSKAKESKERSSKLEVEEGGGASAGNDSGGGLDIDEPLGNKRPQHESKPIRLRYSVKCKPKKERVSRKK